MTKMLVYGLAAAAMAASLAACKTTGDVDPQPVVRTVEVKVPVVVPCKALEQLGGEPLYPDTNAALQAAADIFEQARLLMAGRLMRIQRLDEYATARADCPK